MRTAITKRSLIASAEGLRKAITHSLQKARRSKASKAQGPGIELQAGSFNTVIEEHYLDGSIRKRTYTNNKLVRINLRLPGGKLGVILILTILTAVIGLFAVGPQEVWEWLTELIPTL